MLRDHDIRRALWKRIEGHGGGETGALALHEFPVQARVGIADIAVIDEELVGYEIKSDRDSVRRLAEQIRIYSDVFDRFYCVTTIKHYKRIRQMVPTWWGIILAWGEPVHLSVRRAALPNEAADMEVVLYLLDRAELARIARAEGMRGYSKDDKVQLAARLASAVNHGRLRWLVREAIRSRPPVFWTERQRAGAASSDHI